MGHFPGKYFYIFLYRPDCLHPYVGKIESKSSKNGLNDFRILTIEYFVLHIKNPIIFSLKSILPYHS